MFRYNPAMHISQAFKLLQQGQVEQAREVCAALIERDPPSARTLILMSAIEQRLGDAQAASRYLLDAAELQATDTPAQLSIIQALRTIGALEAASRLLQGLDSNLPEVAISQAQTEWQNGQYEQALAGFEAAAKRWPQQPETSFALCRALLRLAEPARAEAVLVQAAERWPDSSEIHRLWAVLELDRGDLTAALQHLHGKLDAEPEHSKAQKMLSALRMITGQSNQAISPGNGFGAPVFATDDFPVNDFPTNDFMARSFAWVRGQARQIAWFGTNSGLLNWACGQIPGGFPPQGPVVECGVYHGFSLRLLSDRIRRPIHGFDSFQGLPESWKPGEPAGSYSTQGRLPAIAAHVQLHPGWFEQTLPDFAAQPGDPIALLHIDCDLYSSTRTVLTQLGPRLAPGSLLVFDDFLSYEGYEQHEFRAAHEYFAASTQRFELVAAVLLGRAVAYRLVSP
ncbi:MAG TPA: class I SAM-dependent methyltransferase [Xanthomonadales bacterium]|nr:class I SAM-dependent methyltransferase [Xanthomonadales bacterium]